MAITEILLSTIPQDTSYNFLYIVLLIIVLLHMLDVYLNYR